MSAHFQMRAMLDQLMGTDRDGQNNYGIKFNDSAVCKNFLLGCCPHDILAHTRMDLGNCRKIHDLALKADYEKASKTEDYYYDIDVLEYLTAFVRDCDRRTESAERRLINTQRDDISSQAADKASLVYEIAEQIGKKLAKAEALGEAGEVDESFKLMEEVEALRVHKSKAEMEYRESMPVGCYKNQNLRVCKVCSAFLGIEDSDIRLADHFGGKLHVGLMQIREKLAELKKTAGPRKLELEKNNHRSSRNYPDAFYYVGARELDRRSRMHKSPSRERYYSNNDARSRRRRSSSRSSEDERYSMRRSRSYRSRSRHSSHNSSRRHCFNT